MELSHIVFYVKDVPETVAFYEAAFGLTCKRTELEGRYAEMETGPTLLTFSQEGLIMDDYPDVRPSRPHEPAAAAEIVFVTDDVGRDYTRAIKAGATPFVTPHSKSWGQQMAHVRDNNGFLVELCTRHPPSPS